MATVNDDYSAGSDTTGVIAIGGSASGVIETAYDNDWFKTSLVAGTTYQFALTSAGSAPNMQIFGSGYGSYPVQNVSNGPAPVIWFKPSVSGVYYLDVAGNSSIGAYSVHASALTQDDYTDVTLGATALALGGQVSGSIELPGDRDVFQVTLEAGKTYTLTASGAADAHSVAALPVAGFYTSGYNNSSAPIHVNGVADGATVSFTPTTSGVYYAVASDVDALHGSGGYTMQLSAAADDFAANAGGAGALAIGAAAVAGTLNVTQDVDWFKVSLQANQSYVFTLGDSSNHAVINVVDAQGAVLSGNTAYTETGVGQVLYWTPPRAGDYYLQVQATSFYYTQQQTGPYTVQASLAPVDDYSANTGTTGVLTQGHTLAGKIETFNDVDWIKVSLQAGSNYLFDLPNGTLADGTHSPMTDFRLLDGNGTTVQGYYPVYDSSRAVGELTVSYLAASSGDYYLAVSGLPFSSYKVTSYAPVADDVRGDASTTAVLAPGQVIHSAIDGVGDHDWYKVNIGLNLNYSFELDGATAHSGSLGAANGSTALNLYDGSGKLVESSVGSSYADAFIYTYGVAPGNYYLDVTSTGTAVGTYVLKQSGAAGMPDTSPPVASSLSGPTGIGGLTANIVLNYNEFIHLGSGTINLSTAAGQLVESFDVATSTHLTVSNSGNSSLSIDPSADLLPGSDYVLTIGAGSVMDAAGNADYATVMKTFHTVDAPVNLVGTSGNDVFQGGSGGGSFDGGAGLDTLILNGSSYNRSITQGSLSTIVTNYVTGAEVDTLTSIERLRFDNTDIAFDTRGVAGEVYRLYQAAFGRTPDASGLGFWIHYGDNGMSLHDIAAGFMGSPEYAKVYGTAPSDQLFLTNLYQNVLHRAPDADGLAFWSAQMQHGLSHADVLVGFSESPENQVALSPSIQNGMYFTHFVG
ncbi:DUF4214 domain-containing protein [Rugamonas sp.]|uniref:DUF4214 domain-containing protein n=1 Tax=Rugamonas sp. TaxID=1926287 RepID=UPI0025DEE03C|nr:DUF4214 domain-containing protein [Rugamonas sp.]